MSGALQPSTPAYGHYFAGCVSTDSKDNLESAEAEALQRAPEKTGGLIKIQNQSQSFIVQENHDKSSENPLQVSDLTVLPYRPQTSMEEESKAKLLEQ